MLATVGQTLESVAFGDNHENVRLVDVATWFEAKRA
jgi:hypothetical protein